MIGELAQHLFPGGVDASHILRGECFVDKFKMSLPFNLKQHSWIENTKVAIKNNLPIYEAAFVFEDVFAAVDILTYTDNGFVAYEVKRSTDITDTFILDNALQYYVISNNLKLSDFVLIYLNKDYIAELNIPLDQLTIDNCDITKLFVKESVLDKILPIQYKVKSDIVRFKNIQKVGEPKIKRGDHCSIPYECAFIDYCSRY